MKRLESFNVNHLNLLTGIYVSQKNRLDNLTLTTFDIRLTRPNMELVMEMDAIHTIEHLGAIYLRNHEQWKDKIIYWGPMGCRTGFYLILLGNLFAHDIFDLMRETFDFIINFEGDVPGATPIECGNYQEHSLKKAKIYASKFKKEVLNERSEERLNYPIN